MGVAVCAAAVAVALVSPAVAFVAFESAPVRPLALTPDGTRLLVLNTPDARLEVFSVDAAGVAPLAAVPLGLEPVAVAARSNTEVWVVNHLSDSVSIVDLAATPAKVVRTLLVGDEPSDIVFGGPLDASGHFRRAFITTARRGQNLPDSLPANLTTPGVPRALVYVFDADNLGADLGGRPEHILELFGDTPRALAVSPDGKTVYAAVFHSGNQTATATESAVCDGGAAAQPCDLDGVQVPGGLADAKLPGGVPAPNANVEGVIGPEVGLIVKYNRASARWEDELGRNWSNAIRFRLPDLDVFRIDAAADPPRQSAAFAHVGTILFNRIVNPNNGNLYVSNTEARNEVRFESAVRGRLHEARITVIDGTGARPRHLNKHITALPQGYRTNPMPAGVAQSSLATPMAMAIAGDGTVYVAAFGSDAVGVFGARDLEDDTFIPDAARQIAVDGGPSGLVLDEARQRLYVTTRFDNGLKIIDTLTRREVARHQLYNPEPSQITAGRRFLYDARLSSSNGEASCASCHVFGDFDSLAWDLGAPEDIVRPNPSILGPTGNRPPFHPLKGPMTTQTLRGMANQGPMHWRGDRTGASFPDDSRGLDAALAFAQFNGAFGTLLGRDEGKISDAEMKAFTDFILQIQPPPNPVRRLDNQLTPAQANGRRIFRDRDIIVDTSSSCRGCHTLTPGLGQFGTLGQATFDDEPQEFKVPQLKNNYQKVGMFGTPSTRFAHIRPEHAAYQGDQVRGFGFLHDGSMATLFDFLRGEIFTIDDAVRLDLEQFVLAFDTTFAPIVGQQVTLTRDNAAAVGPRLDLLLARARTDFDLVDHPAAKECDLVAHAVIAGRLRGFLMDPSHGGFRSDRAAEGWWSDAQLRELAQQQGEPVTYTCAPPGEGGRMGLDRDGDTLFDQDEIDRGSNPSDPKDPFVVLPTATPTAVPTPTPARCACDCDRDGNVTIDEIVRGVAIAHEEIALEVCARLDRDRDGKVDVTDLVEAVGDAVNGC